MIESLQIDIQAYLKKAKALSAQTVLSAELKNSILLDIAAQIDHRQEQIIQTSLEDYQQALKHNAREDVLSRLKLDEAKIQSCIAGLKALAGQPDPAGQIQLMRELDQELILLKKTYPIGMIAVIFEARPDVILQAAGLAVKTGNFMILKPGQEALCTCSCIMAIVHQALQKFAVPLEMLMLLHSRMHVQELLAMHQYIDLIIPRGSKSLVSYIEQNTKIPVMGHADGICHIFIDETIADADAAIQVVIDSKVQYPAACNAVETVLLHRNLSAEFITRLTDALCSAQVEIFADEAIGRLIGRDFPAPVSWRQEYSSLKLSLHYADDVEDAIRHINEYGSHHTDCILTDRREHADLFRQMVDSANVFQNCSTRFADGYRYGFGAEVGISTHKILDRGSIALEGLMTYKYHVSGKGHKVSDYAGVNAKAFTHKTLQLKQSAED